MNKHILKQYPSNFKHLIAASCLLNIGDSFYLVAFYLAVVSVYKIDPATASIFSLTMVLPRLFSFLYGPMLDQIKNPKKWLIFFHLGHIVLIGTAVICLLFRWPLYCVYLLNIVFSLINTVTISLQTAIVPVSLSYDEQLINRSVDVQYFANSTLDIISNFLATILISVAGYLIVMNISMPIIGLAIYFFFLLKLPAGKEEPVEQMGEETENKEGYWKTLIAAGRVFLGNKRVFSVVLMESFLSGATDMLIALIPLYLLQLGLPIELLGILLGIQKGCDLLGSLVAPAIKVDSFSFFKYDYFISGVSLLLVFILPNVYIKLVFYCIAFLVIGISGNFFNKLFFEHYPPQNLSSLYTFVSTLFAVFGIAFLIVPIFYQNIYFLGIIVNVTTVLFGVVLMVLDKMKG